MHGPQFFTVNLLGKPLRHSTLSFFKLLTSSFQEMFLTLQENNLKIPNLLKSSLIF